MERLGQQASWVEVENSERRSRFSITNINYFEFFLGVVLNMCSYSFLMHSSTT